MQFQKICILPPQKGGGSVRLKHLKKCVKLNWNLSWGWGECNKKILSGGEGGVNIFWNYTLTKPYLPDDDAVALAKAVRYLRVEASG